MAGFDKRNQLWDAKSFATDRKPKHSKKGPIILKHKRTFFFFAFREGNATSSEKLWKLYFSIFQIYFFTFLCFSLLEEMCMIQDEVNGRWHKFINIGITCNFRMESKMVLTLANSHPDTESLIWFITDVWGLSFLRILLFSSLSTLHKAVVKADEGKKRHEMCQNLSKIWWR